MPVFHSPVPRPCWETLASHAPSGLECPLQWGEWPWTGSPGASGHQASSELLELGCAEGGGAGTSPLCPDLCQASVCQEPLPSCTLSQPASSLLRNRRSGFPAAL